ncbi:polynucleotide adenylyltransferase PcnB [Gammaproteobacteria bacterium]|nr:polynucleotide adenylyltransferase PcnB [Gammaproteobacteria bacterium]
MASSDDTHAPQFETHQYHASQLGIDTNHISKGARSVVEALDTAGYEVYLVGGCVRDLLLGMVPKDFDVATNATPQQVMQATRRARIIGRRFKIVHVRAGREVIEVTTFRGSPDGTQRTSDAGRVLDDNEWGSREDDSIRRDITINSLYYQPIDDLVIDDLGGIEDIQDKVIRVIGDVEERYREDPVRMKRVLRFAAKTGFAIETRSAEPIRRLLPLMNDVPGARLLDEAIKMFHGGYAWAMWQQLQVYGMDSVFFPEIGGRIGNGDAFAAAFVEKSLRNTDIRVQEDKPVMPAFLFAVMLWPAFVDRRDELIEGGESPANASIAAAGDVLYGSDHPLPIPRRMGGYVQEIWVQQWWLTQTTGRHVQKTIEHARFRAAYDFLLMRAAAWRQIAPDAEQPLAELSDFWTDLQQQPEYADLASSRPAPASRPRRTHRRPRKPRAPQGD